METYWIWNVERLEAQTAFLRISNTNKIYEKDNTRHQLFDNPL